MERKFAYDLYFKYLCNIFLEGQFHPLPPTKKSIFLSPSPLLKKYIFFLIALYYRPRFQLFLPIISLCFFPWKTGGNARKYQKRLKITLIIGLCPPPFQPKKYIFLYNRALLSATISTFLSDNKCVFIPCKTGKKIRKVS